MDEIPEPMVIASLRAGPGRHADDHRPFAYPPQLLKEDGDIRRRADNSRKKVQIVRADSSDLYLTGTDLRGLQASVCFGPCATRRVQTTTSRWAPEKWASAQAVLHVLRRDCQQISAHPSERNAWWMSDRFSYRTRKRRN